MKIVILNIWYYPYIIGGAEISVQNLAEDLAKKHQVSVISLTEEKEETVNIHSVRVYRIFNKNKSRSKVKRTLNYIYNPYLVKKVKKILLSIRPDVIHTNNISDFSLSIFRIFKKENIPAVHTLRDYGLIHRKWFLKDITRYYSSNAAAVTAPSQYTLLKFINDGYFKRAEYRICIPNAAVYDETDLKRIITEKASKDDEIVDFAYIGRFIPEKGADWLVSVFHDYHGKARLHLYGKGTLEHGTEKLLSSDERMINHGFINQSEMKGEIEKIDVVIVPSVWEEPFGRVILDAYAGGCPVIITDRGGMPEIVDDGRTGRILRQETDESLKAALLYFQDRRKIKAMMPNIPGKLKRYTQEKQTEDFLKLYEQLTHA